MNPLPLLRTPQRRRIAMGVLLALAVVGATLRGMAEDPSELHDLGTLLMLLWLPGNLVIFLVERSTRRPPDLDFPDHPAFTAHLQTQVDGLDLPQEWLEQLATDDRRGTVVVGKRGYTVRLPEPFSTLLPLQGSQLLAMELLRPEVGVPELPAGTEFRLAVGTTVVAKGRVIGG